MCEFVIQIIFEINSGLKTYLRYFVLMDRVAGTTGKNWVRGLSFIPRAQYFPLGSSYLSQ